MPPFIPPELVAAILEEVAGPSDNRDYSTLGRCCLVAKAWLPITQKELYSELTLFVTPDELFSQHPGQLSTLAAHARLAALVTQIEFVADSNETVEEHVEALLTASPLPTGQLKRIIFDNGTYGTEQDVILQHLAGRIGPDLRHVQLSYLTQTSCAFLAQQPRLQSLSIASLALDNDVAINTPPITLALRSLQIDRSFPGEDPRAFNLISHSSRSTLLRLSVSITDQNSPTSMDLPPFVALRYLHLSISIERPSFAIQIIRTLPTTLQHLVLIPRHAATAAPDTVATVLNALPSSLAVLELEWLSLTWTEI